MFIRKRLRPGRKPVKRLLNPQPDFSKKTDLDLVSQIKTWLLNSDFCAALEGVRYLINSKRYIEIPEIIWRTGLEVLNRFQHDRSGAMQFFREVLKHILTPAVTEAIALELYFYLVAEGDFEEAYTMILPLLLEYPFTTRALLHGYAGLAVTANYIATEKGLSEFSQSQNDQNLSQSMFLSQSFYGGQSHSRKTESLYNSAVKHFETCFSLEDGYQPTFVLYYIRLLEKKKKWKRIENLLLKILRKNPTEIFFLRYLYCFLSRDDGLYRDDDGNDNDSDESSKEGQSEEDSDDDDNEINDQDNQSPLCFYDLQQSDEMKAIHVLMFLQQVNPVDDLLIIGIKKHEEKLDLDFVLGVLFGFLDHENYKNDVTIWSKLADYLKNNAKHLILQSEFFKVKTTEDCWFTRHFSLPIPSSEKIEMISCKAACAYYFYGRNSYSSLVFEIVKDHKVYANTFFNFLEKWCNSIK